MQKSSDVDKLYEALAKAQGDMKAAVMDAKNPHFGSKYATLSAIQDAYRTPLSKQGLAVIQMVESDGSVYEITTTLGHSSGQWISSQFKLLVDKQTMQGLGSAITYARRYAVSAMVGIVSDEDDDGNVASQKQQPRPAARKLPEASGTIVPGGAIATNPKNEAPADLAQIKRIASIREDKKIGVQVFVKYLKDVYGVDSKTMRRWQADEILLLMEDADTNEAVLMAAAARKMNGNVYAPPSA